MAIITLGGDPGSGKTTVAAKLAKTLGYKEFYAGDVFRRLAKQRGQPIEGFYVELAKNRYLEKYIDDYQAKLMRENDNHVIQGRVAWHFVRQSPFRTFNIFLGVDPLEGAKRMAARPEYKGKSIEEIRRVTEIRLAAERDRYKKLYGIENYLDHKNYDLSIDTTNLKPANVVSLIANRLRETDIGNATATLA